MKKAILLTLICLIANIASAQNLAVAYNCISTSLKDGHSKTDDAFVLVSDGKRSMFYSPEKWAVDSLMSTPEGKAALQQQAFAQLAAGQPIKTMAKGYYICKNADGTITSFHDEGMIGKLHFTEPRGGIDWQLSDSTKTILGYDCQLAQANFHGRKWSAWFAIELPIQDGPWKLCGLPGLILEAETDGGAYSFTATAVGTTRENIPEIFGKDQYDKTDRIKKFLKEKRDATDHAMERLEARFGTVKITAPDGTPVTKINVSRDVIDFKETDY